MARPSLSVLIDTYNHEAYIEECISSVLEQDFPASDMEIVVVDDGSTDRTPEIVRKFSSRVRLLSKKNGGQASAFNAGIPELRGQVISFLDGDDWFAPGKLTAVMTALEQHPEAAAIGHGHIKVNASTKETSPLCPEKNLFVNLETPKAADQARCVSFYMLMGALTVRRATALRALPIPERLTFCADAPLTAVAMLDGAYIIREAAFYYREHASNLFAARSEPAQLERRYRMSEQAYWDTEKLLSRLGVPRKSIAALFYNSWVQTSRRRLRSCGGNPLDTFRAEMRFFRLLYPDPTASQLAYKYIVGGAAALALPPRTFYRLQDWTSRPQLNRIRKALFGTSRTPA